MAAGLTAMRNYGTQPQDDNPGGSVGESPYGGGGGGRGRPRLPQQQYYNLQHLKQQQQLLQQGIVYDGKRLRKSFHRKAIDYNTAVITYLEDRIWQRDYRDRRAVQPDIIYQNRVNPPLNILDNPVNAVTTRFVRAATNKIRCPIFCLTWTPDGRRVVTGAATGEFTLWQGLSFSFETILQAHDSSIMSMVWSNNDGWLLSGDRNGFVKYWQSNMNNVKMFQAHKDQLLGLSFSPTDQKFASSAADNLVKIWDFWTATEEQLLRGHGAEVKCIAWHPFKSLLVSGSKDSQQPMKLWDPKAGQCLGTFFTHKGGVNDLKWSPNGLNLLSASRDHTIKLYDVRKLREEIRTFRGHRRDATSLAWHPLHQDLFVSGGYDGQLIFWNSNQDHELHSVDRAHESVIYDMSWHPLGHVLTTCSNDFSTRFWIRNRPGDKLRDKANWPMANALPPPLYGRGAALAGASGYDDEDDDGAISTPFGSIDTSAMNVKTANVPPPVSANSAALPPSLNTPMQFPPGFAAAFPPGVALPLQAMLGQPPPAITEAKKAKALANVKLTTQALATETVPGLGDVVNLNEMEVPMPTLPAPAAAPAANIPGLDLEDVQKLKQIQQEHKNRPQKRDFPRGIQKQFEEAWEGGRRQGISGPTRPWQPGTGEGTERNSDSWTTYNMFRASWEGAGYEPAATGEPEVAEDASVPPAVPPEYGPYGQLPPTDQQQHPSPTPPQPQQQGGVPLPPPTNDYEMSPHVQRDYGQQRGYRPTYGEYPPERPDSGYEHHGPSHSREDTYSPGPPADYQDNNYNPSDSYSGPRFQPHQSLASSYYGESAPPQQGYDPYYDSRHPTQPRGGGRGGGRGGYGPDRGYGGAARGCSADDNRNAAKRFREDY